MSRNKNYSFVKYPTPDGKSSSHRPRRNYWGNLYDSDTYDEERHHNNDYGSALYDSEDDHDSYYESGGYD